MFELICNVLFWFITSYLTVRFMKFLYVVTLSIYAHFFTKPLDLTPYKKFWTGFKYLIYKK